MFRRARPERRCGRGGDPDLDDLAAPLLARDPRRFGVVGRLDIAGADEHPLSQIVKMVTSHSRLLFAP
jgi:hypothetical protein